MAASYPGAIKSFTTKTNKVDLVDAAHINDLQLEVSAIETELGADVAGSETDLKTRLFVSIDNDGALRKGTSFPASPKDGQPFYRTDTNTFYIYNGSAWEAFSSQSNVLFQYQGQVNASGGNTGEYTGTSLNPGAITPNNRYLRRAGTSYATVWTTRWTKIAGVTTITILCRLWVDASNTQANLQVDIGGQNNNVSGTNSQTSPEWKSFTIDVSSLTNGTVYDVTASLKDANGTGSTLTNCSNIIGIGS